MSRGPFPFRCRQAARSADGLTVEVAVEGTLSVYDDPLDARAFEELAAKSAGPAAAAKAVADRCMPDAVRRVCAARPAERIESLSARQWQDELAEAAKAVLFESGLQVAACTKRSVRCAELEQRRAVAAEAEAVAQRHREREKADAARHESQMAELDRRTELLARYRELQARMPDLSVEQIAKDFADEDREALYRLLIATQTGAATTRMLWAVSGNELLGWAGGEFDQPGCRLRLPVEVGSLRSVSVLTDGPQPQLAVGGRGGVAIVGVDPLAVMEVLAMPAGGGGQFGVNAAIRSGRTVWATHSGVGLVAWPTGEPGEGRVMLGKLIRAGGTVRGLCRCGDGRLALADGDRVVAFQPSATAPDATAYDPLGAEITALQPWQSGLLIGVADGRVLRQEPGGAAGVAEQFRLDAAVTGLAVLAAEPPRLIVADDGFGLRCRVLGERAEIESRYAAPGRRCRWAAAAGDYLYAGTTDRTGVLAWRVGEPQEPAHWINVRRLTQHSVADVAVML